MKKKRTSRKQPATTKEGGQNFEAEKGIGEGILLGRKGWGRSNCEPLPLGFVVESLPFLRGVGVLLYSAGGRKETMSVEGKNKSNYLGGMRAFSERGRHVPKKKLVVVSEKRPDTRGLLRTNGPGVKW